MCLVFSRQGDNGLFRPYGPHQVDSVAFDKCTEFQLLRFCEFDEEGMHPNFGAT